MLKYAVLNTDYTQNPWTYALSAGALYLSYSYEEKGAFLATVSVTAFVYWLASRYFSNNYSHPEAGPGDFKKFQAAFNEVYDQLLDEEKIEDWRKFALIHIDPEEGRSCDWDIEKLNTLVATKQRSHYYEQAKKGICYGMAVTLLQGLHKNLDQSPIDIVKNIKLRDIVHIQLTRDIDCKEYTSTEIVPFDSNWFPSETLRQCTFGIPWKETTCVFYAISSKEIWQESLASYFQTKNITEGRVSFPTENAGHTISFWHRKGKWGFFDAWTVKQFRTQKLFFSALRGKILEYAACYGGTTYQAPPVAVYTKKADCA